MENMLILAAYDFAFFKAVFLCAIALGLIIFIHELGHFLVAKACGVRCDKFYIGFDFFGLKLLKFKYGETEYGIGVFPLGGYVKMLGQEDNPGETKERLAKAKAAREALEKNANAQVDKEFLMTDEEIQEAENLINDPRSYQAKSVPQRLAIIVAGVTMNVVLAFIAAVAAFMLGTFKIPCEIGSVHPGQAAWEAGLQSNDQIVQIGKNELKYFDDISKNVMLGSNLEDGINVIYQRGGLPMEVAAKAYPKKCALAPMLGATSGEIPVLDLKPVTPASPTFCTDKELKTGDVLVSVNGTPIRTNLDYQKALYATTGENVTLKFLRPSQEAQEKRLNALRSWKLGDTETWNQIEAEYIQDAESFELMVQPMNARHFGVVFTMGPVQAVRSNLNGLEGAGRAGIKPGDLIVGFEMTVDGKPHMIRNPDPMKLPYMVQKQAKYLTAQEVLKKMEAPAESVPAAEAGEIPTETPNENPTAAEVPASQTVSDEALAAGIGTPAETLAETLAETQTEIPMEAAVEAAPAAEEQSTPLVLRFAVLKKETGKEEIVPVEFSLDVFSASQYLFGCGEVLPEIGLTYEIEPKVSAVMPGSEAEKCGIKPGFELSSISFKYEEPSTLEPTENARKVLTQFEKESQTHVFRKDVGTWPMVYHNFMLIYPSQTTFANVEFRDPETQKTVSGKLPIQEYEDTFVYHSDLNFEARKVFIKEGLGSALVLGGQETWNSLTMVYRMLGKLFTGQVSVKGLGGPVLIAQVAYSSAREGLSRLLMFVCLISANLAVLNLLPIPVLDGGHVVFLLWEGITGKEPNENLVIILSYMGLLLFLGLTIFVLGLDLGLIPRI